MPGIFEERDRGYEAKWSHDTEKNFKVLARRNKLLGNWAAAELGLSGRAAGDYAEVIVLVGLTGKDPDRVSQKIKDDFHAKRLDHADRWVHVKMEEFFRIASEEVSKDSTRSSSKE